MSLRLESGLGLGALLLFVAGRCLVPMDETDLFFNLRLGEIVLETGAVPRTNLLSFTCPDATDVNLAWLFQVLLALVHRTGGIPATVLLKTAFVLASWALLYRVALRRGAHPALAAPALALAAWAAEPRFVERPHLVTFLGLALLALALEREEQGRPRLLYALVPLGFVWANANSCFFLAPSLLALYAAGCAIEGRRQEAGRAGVVALVLVPICFATPSGAGWLEYVANHFRMPWLRPLQEYRVAEWPLDGPFFMLAAGVLAVTAADTYRAAQAHRSARGMPDTETDQNSRVRCAPGWRQLLPVLALAVLGARRIRFVAEFAMFAGPLLAAGATRLVAPWWQRAERRLRAWPTAVVAGGLVALALVPRAAAVRAGRPALELGIEAGLLPLAAIEFVERNGLAARMYNDLEVGSYLTWRWPGARRVFQDPRINGYPPAFHALLRRADVTGTEWQALMDRHQVASALITYPGVNPRGALFDPVGWALVYRGGDGLVFVRRQARFSGLIAARELPASMVYSAAEGARPVALATQPATSAVAACAWQRRLGDLHLELGDERRARAAYARAMNEAPCAGDAQGTAARRAFAALALRQGDAAEALAALDGVPGAEAASNRGFALLALGRNAEALAAFEQAVAAGPAQGEALFGQALALEALGRSEQAARLLRAFVARFPDHLAIPEATRRLARLPARP